MYTFLSHLKVVMRQYICIESAAVVPKPQSWARRFPERQIFCGFGLDLSKSWHFALG